MPILHPQFPPRWQRTVVGTQAKACCLATPSHHSADGSYVSSQTSRLGTAHCSTRGTEVFSDGEGIGTRSMVGWRHGTVKVLLLLLLLGREGLV